MSKKSKSKFADHRKGQRPKEAESPVKAKKHLGQHFLRDEGIAQQIAETLSFNGYTDVIEIGPGTGVLTKYLLLQEVHLTAMDVDPDSIAYLNHSFHGAMDGKGTLTVLEADFLKVDLDSLFGHRPFAIIGNFPYNISTQIVFKMLEYRHRIPEFSGMFQKEVALRICEKKGSKAYGILSVLVQAFYEAEYLFTVPPQVFEPPPKVHSGVLRLVRKTHFQLDCDEALFFKVVKTAFNQRRKTLRNSLKTFEFSEVHKEDAIFGLRPEQLAVSDFTVLTKKIANDAL